MLLSVSNYVLLPTAKQLWIISRSSSIDSTYVDLCMHACAYVCDYFFYQCGLDCIVGNIWLLYFNDLIKFLYIYSNYDHIGLYIIKKFSGTIKF